MIEHDEPPTWHELQSRVARIIHEAGCNTAVEKVIRTVRGKVSVDVWAYDSAATPSQTYLIECKRWRARVPQTVVHAFRTVVGDSGANWGAIISAAGFQKGARVAAQYSNVRLLSWAEIQELFAPRWYSNHFLPKIEEATRPLREYTEPLNSRIFRKADRLKKHRRQEYRRLREAYQEFGTLCMGIIDSAFGWPIKALAADPATLMPGLPLRHALKSRLNLPRIAVPVRILDAQSYRSLLESIVGESQVAIAQFDEVFGERA